MESQNVVNKGNTLTANFSVKCKKDSDVSTHTSTQYLINSSAVVQFRVDTTTLKHDKNWSSYKIFIFLLFTKHQIDDDCTYVMKFTSKELKLSKKSFTSDDGTWHLLTLKYDQHFTFDVMVEIKVAPHANSFACLHEDTELTDFELRGDDGSVAMHRLVLAAASPVLRRMFGGEWRETAEGHVEVPGITKATLQNFKNWVYLRTLPESGLEELLLLASYYMMPELEQSCVDKLVQNLSAANACNILEFALKHKVTGLLLDTLKSVKSDAVWFDDMVDHFTCTNNK